MLIHGGQMKDDFVFLRKLSNHMFYGAVLARYFVQNFLKHIQKAHF
jgi:hypothetical protein